MTFLDFTRKVFWIRQIKGPPVLTSAMVSLLLRPINLGSLFAMPFLLSQPCFLSIWTKPLPWAPVFFVRSNPLSFHNSHPASLSIRIKLHSRLFRHATTLPMTVELRCHLLIRGKFTTEATDLIPTPPHRLSPLFRPTGSRSRRSNCRQVSKGHLLLHLQNPTIEHLKSHFNLAILGNV